MAYAKRKMHMYSKSELKGKTQEELIGLVLDMQFCNVNLAAEREKHLDRIANLEEILRLKTAEKFTPSSEQTSSLFDELELLAQFEAQKNGLPESEQIEVEAHTRKKYKARENSTLPASTPVVDVYNYEEAPSEKVINGVMLETTDFNQKRVRTFS